MKWTFRLRNKEVSLTAVQGVTAVRPSAAARRRAATRSRLVQVFGRDAVDTSQGGRFGIDLPSRNRQLFERTGWLFVEPRQEVADVAAGRSAGVETADAVRPVFVDASGNLVIGTDLLTVQLAEGTSEDEARRRISDDGLQLVRRIGFAPGTYEVRVSGRASRPLTDSIEALQAARGYRFAEPMLLQAITGRSSFRPGDPHYDRQWQFRNDGSNGGTVGADVRAEAAWAFTRGKDANGRPVRIAVIDNGMQVRHPDLRPGVVGGGYFDSDGTGTSVFVRYQAGMTDFPNVSHGTFCMGMAGARTNGRGGCGAAPEADLLAVACMDDQIGTQVTLARALAYAADPTVEDAAANAADGADVIVCSLGPNGADWDLTSVLDQAITFAARQARGGRGVPIFWACANGHVELARDEVVSHPDVIAVGRSNRNDLADGSAFGPRLDFLAPGVEVYSTRSGSRYGFDTGTSFAAPLAAGVGALVLASHPTWTANQVRRRMRTTCDQVGGVVYNSRGHHPEYGFGRVNAAEAVK